MGSPPEELPGPPACLAPQTQVTLVACPHPRPLVVLLPLPHPTSLSLPAPPITGHLWAGEGCVCGGGGALYPVKCQPVSFQGPDHPKVAHGRHQGLPRQQGL